MNSDLTVIRLGGGTRLAGLIEKLKEEAKASVMDWRDAFSGEDGRAVSSRVIFAVSVDGAGPSDEYYGCLRYLREHRECLKGCTGGLVVDGTTELYTKSAACELVLAGNGAGCLFIGKALVEGTGSLYNQHIVAGQWGLSLFDAYEKRVLDLAERIREFEAPRFERPRIAMIHASENKGSNTLWIANRAAELLADRCRIETLSLLNGTIYDCRGCSFEACRHFSENETCFYGGPITEQALPLIKNSDAILFLCPNYNDSVSANIMALINRMNNLLLRSDLSSKYVFAVIVSGYSGSDIVAKQLLGAVSLNKTLILPPYFCLMQTAHDPGSAGKSEGIEEKIRLFAENIGKTLLK